MTYHLIVILRSVIIFRVQLYNIFVPAIASEILPDLVKDLGFYKISSI